MMNSLKNTWLLLGVLGLLALGTFLRSHQLTNSPPALYWEEAALGYDAYSVAQTGHDHHGNAWPILAFESFGDWKPSLYFYYLVPFVSLGGLNEFSVRLAGIMVGVVVMIGVVVLAKELRISSLAAAVVAAFSPWAIHFSRGAWEAHLAAALILWGVIAWLKAVNANRWWWWISASLLFGLASYAYHAARLIVPLLVLWLLVTTLIINRHQLRKLKDLIESQVIKWAFFSSLLIALMMLPLLLGLLNSNSSVITQRFKETGLTNDLAIVEKSNRLKEINENSFFSRLIYHRYLLMTETILENAFSYTSADFWFVNGDENMRHSPGYIGHLYYFEIIFLLMSLVALVRSRRPWRWLLLGWIFIAIIPAAMSKPNPHALRILPALPAILLIIALGLESSYTWLSKFAQRWFSKKIAVSGTMLILAGMYLFSLTVFYRHYLLIYPVEAASDWQYGYKQMVTAIKPYIGGDQPVYISRSEGRPAMYVWFYTNEDPRLVQQANSTALKDQGEFLTYQNIEFVRQVDDQYLEADNLLVMTAAEYNQLTVKQSSNDQLVIIEQVKNLADEIIWVIAKVK